MVLLLREPRYIDESSVTLKVQKVSSYFVFVYLC